MRYPYIVITKTRVIKIMARSLAHATRALKQAGIDFLSVTAVTDDQ